MFSVTNKMHKVEETMKINTMKNYVLCYNPGIYYLVSIENRDIRQVYIVYRNSLEIESFLEVKIGSV